MPFCRLVGRLSSKVQLSVFAAIILFLSASLIRVLPRSLRPSTAHQVVIARHLHPSLSASNMVDASEHAEHKHNEATANQSGGLACEGGSSNGTLSEGHPPQKPGARFPLNTCASSPCLLGDNESYPMHRAVEGVPFYTPAIHPSSGTALSHKKPPKLFEQWQLRDAHFKNRIIVSPMCQCAAFSHH